MKTAGSVGSWGRACLMAFAMLQAGCGTTSVPRAGDPSKMQFLRVDPGVQAFSHQYPYTGSAAEVRVYESDRDVFVFIRDHDDPRQQRVRQLTTGQVLGFQPPSPSRVNASADDLMRSLNARLVFEGSLQPGRSVYHGLARDLGIEYYLRPYRIGSRGGQISVEYALYNDAI